MGGPVNQGATQAVHLMSLTETLGFARKHCGGPPGSPGHLCPLHTHY